jgi:hypothetical protein
MCPTWKWNPAIDKKHTYEEFPAERQYLSSKIQSAERAKDALQNVTIVENVYLE